MNKHIAALVVIFLFGVNSLRVNAVNVEAHGLFKGSAVLVIDGTQRLLKVGQLSPEGVKLLASDSKQALVEIDGKSYPLTLTRRISSNYKAAELAEVRLQSSDGGHYITPARINGRAVTVMVDTGATMVSMNQQSAENLRLDYKKGIEVRVSTANGMAKAYQMMLDSVTVGTVTVYNVRATITASAYPDIILLGNSYLGKVQMSQDNGILVLQSKL